MQGTFVRSPDGVKSALESLNIRPDKRLGQNFIIDEGVVRRQVREARLSKVDTVLEIGPGFGALTGHLAENVERVIAIERDRRLCGYLRERFPGGNVDVVCADALVAPLPGFSKCVSNLPYSISSDITFRLLEQNFELAVLMYQDEFARRMVAGCGTDGYSRLSVSVFYRAECRLLERVPRGAFYPVPDVDSAIVSLRPRENPPFKVQDERLFFEILAALFSHRRKKVANGLELWLRGKGTKRPDLFRDFEFADNRVEDLSPEEIGRLSDEVFRVLGGRI